MKTTLTLPLRAYGVGATNAFGRLHKMRRWWRSVKDHDAITKAGLFMYAMLLFALGALAQVVLHMSFIFCTVFLALGGGCVALAWLSKSIPRSVPSATCKPPRKT